MSRRLHELALTGAAARLAKLEVRRKLAEVDRDAAILRALDEQMTVADVARIVGLTRQRVDQLAKAAAEADA